MAIALVQDAENGGTSTTSTTVTLGATPTNGNLLVAVCAYRADTTLTIPTGFTLAVDRQAGTSDSSNVDTAIFWRIANSDDTTHDFTLNMTGFVAAWVGEYSSDGWESSPVDVTASGTTSSLVTTLSSGTTATTAQAEELVIVGFGHRNGTTDRSYTNSFVEQSYAAYGSPTVSLSVADKILSATGTQETTKSWTATGCATTVAIATFKVSASMTADPGSLLLLGVG